MKTNRILTFLLAGSLFLFTGCNDRVEQIGEDLDHDHEQHDDEHGHDHDHGDAAHTFTAAKAEIVMARGHFHGLDFHADAISPKAKHLQLTQTMILTADEHGWEIAADSPTKQFVLQGGKFSGSDKAPEYAIRIRYFDKDGEEITGHLVEDGAADKTQHFFIAKNFKPFYKESMKENLKADDSFYKFTYRDSNPWDKTFHDDGTQLIGDTQPIGLKGVFSFYESYITFDMEVQLMHLHGSKKGPKGELAPFYAPGPWMKTQGAHPTITMTLPFVLFSDSNEYVESETWEEYQEQPAGSMEKNIVGALAKAYGATEREAFNDLYLLIMDIPAHNIDEGFHL